MNEAGHRERLRQRFLTSGLPAFADHEVVELFLTLCIPRKDVKSPAKALLQKFGSIQKIFDADIDALSQIKDVGHVAPIAIKIIKSLAEIYLRKNIEIAECSLNSQEKLEEFWRLRLGGIEFEVLEIALLNPQFQLLENGVLRLGEGVVHQIQVQPRKIIEYALQHHASAIIIAHNHPSGATIPSREDYFLTKEVEKAAEPLDIILFDHFIITHCEIFSFRKEKLINPTRYL
ncbi:MAG: DNA repair protein RadC [Puniceicoccales bacterium]|nr:DNA repair protein RadC [Puniceicoccales bacterium]